LTQAVQCIDKGGVLLNKTFKFLVPLIAVLLIVGLTLPACTSQKPAETTPTTGGALSFVAAEYVNTDYGFSVKYPKDWVQQQNTPGIVFLASPAKRVPALSVAIQSEATFADALKANMALNGSDINITTQRSTTLADGTPAFEAVVKWKTQGLGANTFALGVQKDGNWIIVAITTVSLLAKYDETLFSEIVHTLQFK
jgi:hypothetical protein